MNGDDTLDWAKKPAVPDNRKRAVTKKATHFSCIWLSRLLSHAVLANKKLAMFVEFYCMTN